MRPKLHRSDGGSMKRRYTKTFCNVCERECWPPQYTEENFQGVTYDICKACAAVGARLEVTERACRDGETRQLVRVIHPVEVED